MAKLFFDVFPTLKLNSEERALFETAEVKSVSTNTSRDYIHISLCSDHLIPKKIIHSMERRIKEQLFAKTPISVSIEEDYQLSELYTAEHLFHEYEESLLYMLRDRSMVEASMFSNAEVTFGEGNHILFSFEDSVLARGKEEEFVRFLKDYFALVFHRELRVEVRYRKPKVSRLKEHNELRLNQEIAAIIEQNEGVEDELRAEKEAKAEKKKAAAEKKEAKKQGFVPRVKKDSDPNLIYGRDFDDETIELVQVVGEMGEIAFRGQVTHLEAREIKNEKTILIFTVTDFTDSITVKIFAKNEQLPELLGELREGAFLKIKGMTNIDRFDNELAIGSVVGIKKIPSGRIPIRRNVWSSIVIQK